jgi:hypothetical protein
MEILPQGLQQKIQRIRRWTTGLLVRPRRRFRGGLQILEAAFQLAFRRLRLQHAVSNTRADFAKCMSVLERTRAPQAASNNPPDKQRIRL